MRCSIAGIDKLEFLGRAPVVALVALAALGARALAQRTTCISLSQGGFFQGDGSYNPTVSSAIWSVATPTARGRVRAAHREGRHPSESMSIVRRAVSRPFTVSVISAIPASRSMW